MNILEQDIINYLSNRFFSYVKIVKEVNIEKIHNMMIKNNKLDIDNLDHEVLHYIGVHYYINKKYDEALKYFNMAIEKDNVYSMAIMGIMYQHGIYFGKNIDLAIKYFERASNKENGTAMLMLGSIYHNIGSHYDYNLALKYYVKYCNSTEDSLNEFITIDKNKIIWEDYLHEYWPNKGKISTQIFMLLLISKNRFKCDHLSWMVKGITRMIIRHLANYGLKS